MTPPRIMVTGCGGPAGRSLVIALAARDAYVVGVDMTPSSVPGIAVEPVLPATDPAFVPALLDVAHRHRIDVVVPTVSEELPALASIAAVRFGRPRIVVALPGPVSTANDKWLTAGMLARAGIDVPRSALPSTMPEATRRRILGVPYLSKPRRGRGGRDVTVHRGATCDGPILPRLRGRADSGARGPSGPSRIAAGSSIAPAYVRWDARAPVAESSGLSLRRGDQAGCRSSSPPPVRTRTCGDAIYCVVYRI